MTLPENITSMEREKIAAVIPAAGSGERMGLSENKPFLLLGGKPVLVHALERFQESPFVSEIVLVVRASDRAKAKAVVDEFKLWKVIDIIEGGKHRTDSVFRGLEILKGRGIEIVIIHDGVRPFVAEEKLQLLLAACREHGAAVLAVRPKDTIKQSNNTPFVEATLERSKLWAVQTPQAFSFDLLWKAYDPSVKGSFVGTDDASLVERLGVKVRIVEGSYDNIKITTPEDLELAEIILRRLTSTAR